jgi:hypothetical protein
LCGYPPDQVEPLTGPAASALACCSPEHLPSAPPGDTAFLFHVGHGDYGTTAHYLLSHDARIEDKVVAGAVSQVGC